MLRVFNGTARYVDQGSRRLGSFAIYLETWHADVESFIQLRKNHGSEEERCRDLFLALWVSDLFGLERAGTALQYEYNKICRSVQHGPPLWAPQL